MVSEHHPTKAILLDRISSSWHELQRLLSDPTEIDFARVNPSTGWRVADHLAHLAAWERGIVYLLTRRPRHEGMGITAEQWRDLTMDEVNEIIHQRWRNIDGTAILDYSRTTHEEMLAALAALDDADLRRDYAYFDAGSAFPGRPIIGWIVGNTYEHFKEHQIYIQEIMSR
jgi:hypothetical protein